MDAVREAEAAEALAALQRRCEAAEQALCSAQSAREKTTADDTYIQGLNRQIANLQAILLDREAAIAHAETSLEQMRLGMVAKPPPAHWEPLPGALRQSPIEVKAEGGHLLRDFMLVFGFVMGGCLLFFFGPTLPSGNWPLPDLASLLASDEGSQDTSPPPAPPARLPQATVQRALNLRALPSTDAPIIMALRQGMTVTILEQDGAWDHVEIAASGQPAQQGWAYGSYLAPDKIPAP
jgi:hypothetical protein